MLPVPPDEGQDAELRIGLLMLVEKPEVPEQLPVFLLHLRVLKLLLERGPPRKLGAFLSTREVLKSMLRFDGFYITWFIVTNSPFPFPP